MPPPEFVAELPERVHWFRLRLALPLKPLLKMPPPEAAELPERVQVLRVSWTALLLPLPSAKMAPPRLPGDKLSVAFPPVRVRP